MMLKQQSRDGLSREIGLGLFVWYLSPVTEGYSGRGDIVGGG